MTATGVVFERHLAGMAGLFSGGCLAASMHQRHRTPGTDTVARLASCIDPMSGGRPRGPAFASFVSVSATARIEPAVFLLIMCDGGEHEGSMMPRVLIGLGIPFTALVVMLPLINEVTFTLFNIPFLYIWMFSWFILTTVCLGVCWLCFDRYRPEA